jgi:FkbM family methyltransferase
LLATGLYTVVFRAYAWGLAAAHPADSRTIEAGDATAEVAIETPTETVSVLHTLEKEGDILEQFAADIKPSDRVVDIGANVGVFSAVASDLGAYVIAIEPHPPTVVRLRANCPDAHVEPVAVGADAGTVALGVTNDAGGTQRPAVGDGDAYEIPQRRADELPLPDVVKVDVEGAELAVLEGAAGWFEGARPRVWWIETHDGRAAAVRDVLARQGYAVEVVRDGDTETYLRATDDAAPAAEGQEDTNA